MASYFGGGSGLGFDLTDLFDHVAEIEKKADKHEFRMAPLMNETFALQSASLQAQQQTVLQQTQLEQAGGRSEQLMNYIPWVLGGLGALVGIVLVIRVARGRK